MPQTIKTPGGETLVLMSLDEYEDMQDVAAYDKAKAAMRPEDETLTLDEALAFAEASTPLHFWRRKRGITPAQLAEKVGISESYVASLEGGDDKGDPMLFKKLAAALHVRRQRKAKLRSKTNGFPHEFRSHRSKQLSRLCREIGAESIIASSHASAVATERLNALPPESRGAKLCQFSRLHAAAPSIRNKFK